MNKYKIIKTLGGNICYEIKSKRTSNKDDSIIVGEIKSQKDILTTLTLRKNKEIINFILELDELESTANMILDFIKFKKEEPIPPKNHEVYMSGKNK